MKKIFVLVTVALFLGINTVSVFAVDPPKKKDNTETKTSVKSTTSKDQNKKACTKDGGTCCKGKDKK